MSVFENLKNKVKNITQKSERILEIPEIPATKTELLSAQLLWKQMYTNKSPWINKNIKSLNLAATIAAEISRIVTLEIKSTVDNDEINDIYQREVMENIRNRVEYGLALGGIIMKPYITNNKIKIDFTQPTDFDVLGSNSDGTITEIIFRDYRLWKEKWYVRLEYHLFNEATGSYLIKNEVRTSDEKGMVGNKIHDFSEITPWAGMETEFELQNITAPLFGYFRPAVSNNIDTRSSLGISIYARAVDAIQRADEGLSSLLRELRVKEAKQYISRTAIPKSGSLPYLEYDYYIKLESAGKLGDSAFFESYSPPLYIDDYLKALNEYKTEIEDCIGLARGTLSDPQWVEKTATEINRNKHRTSVLVTENQKNLQDCFEKVVYAISVWLKYPSVPPELGVITDFDESAWTDWDMEVKSMQEDVAMGLLKPEIYMAKKYGVSQEEALSMIPESEALLRGTTVPDDGGGE